MKQKGNFRCKYYLFLLLKINLIHSVNYLKTTSEKDNGLRINVTNMARMIKTS